MRVRLSGIGSIEVVGGWGRVIVKLRGGRSDMMLGNGGAFSV